VVVFMVESGWYSIVAWAMSTPRPIALYSRFSTAVDRAVGTVLAGLGGAFAVDGIRSAVR
jgi:threonine/homoserine/homoserine lactone efflux protein